LRFPHGIGNTCKNAITGACQNQITTIAHEKMFAGCSREMEIALTLTDEAELIERRHHDVRESENGLIKREVNDLAFVVRPPRIPRIERQKGTEGGEDRRLIV